PTPSQQDEEEVMSHTKALHPAAAARGDGAGYRRFLWGGLGALAPTIISLAILDHTAVADYLANIEGNAAWLGGYAFRFVVLFVIGGLWAYFHRAEIEPLKLFQLGIVAPAMITGMINASTVAKQENIDHAWLSAPFALVAPAYADDNKP